MYAAKTVLGSYLYQLSIRKVPNSKLQSYFTIANLYTYLKEYRLVAKDFKGKSYGQLIVAVKNANKVAELREEWNSIKNSIVNEN
jgi:hypothetical protein